MNNGVDLDSLQGWLVKEKSKHSKFNVFGNEDTRWFKVQNLAAEGARVEELALVYFLNEKSRDAKGWIFLKDISEISDDGDAFKIVSYARTMVLHATTRAEHRFWVLNLVKLSINCQYRGSTISASDYDAICGSRRRRTPPEEAKIVGGALLKGSVPRDDGAELSAPPSPRSAKHREKPPLARVDSREREDHRMDDYPRGGGAPSSSARLRDHIAGSASPRRGARSKSPANRSLDSGGSGDADLGETRDDRSGNSRDHGTLYDGDYGSHGKKGKHVESSELDDVEEDLAYTEAKQGAEAKDTRRPDNHSPRSASPPAEKKKKPPPMPAGPAPSMPRKARDVLATAVNDRDGAAASPRRSIDAMLAVDRCSDVKHHSSDEEELGTDFIKEEKRRYGSGASGNSALNAAESKDGGLPPRAPRSPREPIAYSDAVSSGMHRSGRSSTPPRRGADPGSAVDPNFVAENWDNDDDDDPPVVHRNSKGGSNSRDTPVSIGSSVKADHNWLDENFDDD